MATRIAGKAASAFFLAWLVFGQSLYAEDFQGVTPTKDDLLNALDPPAHRALSRPGAAVKAMPPASASLTINFDFNSARISASSLDTLNAVLETLKDERLANKSFEIVGHTDAKGSEEYNKVLSERRATAIVGWLVRRGVSASALKPVGAGESRLKNKSNPEGAENRRVEIVVTGGG